VPDLVETIQVEHITGGVSRLTIKSYDQGRLRWQGDSINFLWYDEEPDPEIYSEGTTRLKATHGIAYMTFTPLLGMSDVVKRFTQEKPTGTRVIQMTIDDALHYTEAERALITASYPEHEREARAKGIPVLGSGRVFPVTEESIREMAVALPKHWPRIAGLDIGWDHPTACVWGAWDRDADVLHVYDAYRQKQQTPVVHAAAIRARGAWIPVAWPHDALQHDKGGNCEQIAVQYRKQGVNMLNHHATHPPDPAQNQKEGDGGYSLEAGIMDLLNRMQTGRLKVAAHLQDWWEEFRLYHRKDGKIVAVGDDLMSATRVMAMMLRHAKVGGKGAEKPLPEWEPTDRMMGALG
jgi:phage terminase large subunit-like protein